MYSYDFDNDGKITREDARIVMSFLGKKFFNQRAGGLGLTKNMSDAKGKMGQSVSPDRNSGVKKFKIQKGQMINNAINISN